MSLGESGEVGGGDAGGVPVNQIKVREYLFCHFWEDPLQLDHLVYHIFI